jgi:hypothetical protein
MKKELADAASSFFIPYFIPVGPLSLSLSFHLIARLNLSEGDNGCKERYNSYLCQLGKRHPVQRKKRPERFFRELRESFAIR